MKYNYFLFGFDTCYPLGGMEDCILKTNDYKEIKKRINLYLDFHENCYDDHDDENYSFYQIYNLKTDKFKTISMYHYRKAKGKE